MCLFDQGGGCEVVGIEMVGSRWWGRDGGCTFMFGVREWEGSISVWGQERWCLPKWQVAVLEMDVELVRGMGSRAGWARSSGWWIQTLVPCRDELRDGFGCRGTFAKQGEGAL